MKADKKISLTKKLVADSGIGSVSFIALYKVLSDFDKSIIDDMLLCLTTDKNLKPFVEFVFKKKLKEQNMSIYALKQQICDLMPDTKSETIDSWGKNMGSDSEVSMCAANILGIDFKKISSIIDNRKVPDEFYPYFLEYAFQPKRIDKMYSALTPNEQTAVYRLAMNLKYRKEMDFDLKSIPSELTINNQDGFITLDYISKKT